MVYLIGALISGIGGALAVVPIPDNKKSYQNMTVLFFTALGVIFSWKTGLAAFRGESVEIALNIGELAFIFSPDPLGAIFAIIASSMWLFAAIYSFGYMGGRKRQKTYYSFFMASLSATLGVAFSGNLIALYLFYELLTLVTYPLVIHGGDGESMKAGSKYIIYSLSGAGVLLAAIVITYTLTGNPVFGKVPLLAGNTGFGLNWLLLLFIVGFGVKAAIMPLHKWLPSAMVAPTPVSALLHAVAVVYSGVFGILRVVYSIFGHGLTGELLLGRMLPWVAVFTILTGVYIATRQDVLKRRLAYHTISQLSYILLGAFILQPWGLTGAILHMISYSTLKVTLFFCAGIIAATDGRTEVSTMEGVGWLLPKTMVSFGVASLGMIGMLPLNTFWSKYYLMKGSVAAGKWPFALVLIISGVINAVCFIPTFVDSFKGKREGAVLERGSTLWLMLAPTLILASIALFIGIYPGVVISGVESVVNWFF